MKLYKATLETEHFTFEAYSTTRSLAKNALINGLHKHANQYKLPLAWHKEYEIETWEFETGQCFRDGEVLCAS